MFLHISLQFARLANHMQFGEIEFYMHHGKNKTCLLYVLYSCCHAKSIRIWVSNSYQIMLGRITHVYNWYYSLN